MIASSLSYKKHWLLPLFSVLFLANTVFSQCAVAPPPGVTIGCGGSTTLAATTNAVTYSMTATACSPVVIAGTNAFPVACDDCVTGQIPIGFSFNFYGNIYTTAVIQSNGIVGFGAFTFTGFSSFAIPAGGAPNNYIAGMFADIDIRYGGTITYQTVGVAPNRRFVVSYNNVVPYNMGSGAGTGTASFQIILNENGSFNIVISQLSANWNASTSGALATSGAENIDGTYAFPVPGRNATDWPGITTTNLDCYLFNPAPCTFTNWTLGGTIVSTNPNYTVSPTATTTYTANWNCNGSACTGNTIVTVTTGTFTLGTVTNNSNCATPNGSIAFNTNLTGALTINYLFNGAPMTATVTVSGGVVTLPNLGAGTYTNFTIPGACPITAAGTATITSPSLLVTTGASICQGGTPVLTSAACGVTGTTIAQGAVFNSGALATTDPMWYRNYTGTTCSATTGTSYYYDVFSFTVSTAGSYTFDGCFPAVDGHASLYQNAFNPASPCGVPANHVITDDDGSTACGADPKLIATLSPGITYYIISTTFPTLTTSNYSWTFTGPAGATLNAGGSGSTLQWYTTPTGGASISSAASFNPVGVAGSGMANSNTPGTYTYYAACSSSPTCRTATTVVISAQSVPPTSISGTGTICNGSSATLGLVGGTLASGANWQWYTGSCGGTPVGTGSTLTVTPSGTTTYYVNAPASGGCAATACVSGTVTLPTAGTTLANNNESATCVVNQNGYVHFYHSSGRLLVSIDSHGQNLGNVSATAYVGTPVDVPACLIPSYMVTVMGRHWVINPQFQPATPVDVVLHYDQTEFTTLMAAANVNISAYDNLTAITDLKLSKYSGPLNVDALASNNCAAAGGNGGTTLHNQAASGNTATMLAGFSGTSRFTRFAIPGFSEFWLHGSTPMSPLPVDLLSFTANCESGNAMKIQWSTASETNCYKYVVERSLGTPEWTQVAQVVCTGNSQQEQDYSVVDLNRANGTSYYRLKQIDNNGDEVIYDAVSVTCGSDELAVVVYPNPAQNNVSVQISSDHNLGSTVIEFTDVTGKVIFIREIEVEKGQTLVPFVTTELSSGPYFIKVNNAEQKFEPLKIIIQK